MNERINTLKFAISAGLVIGFSIVLTTFFAILNLPGYTYFALWLENIYSAYGYSVSYIGILIGGIYGFIEGFVWIGLIVLVYNKLVGGRR